MTDAWFSPQTAPYFSLFSLLAVAAVVEVWAKQGRHRRSVVGLWNASLGLAAIFLIAALSAWRLEQPAYVTLTLAVVGLLIGSVFLGTRRQIRGWYQEAELRRTIAADL